MVFVEMPADQSKMAGQQMKDNITKGWPISPRYRIYKVRTTPAKCVAAAAEIMAKISIS